MAQTSLALGTNKLITTTNNVTRVKWSRVKDRNEESFLVIDLVYGFVSKKNALRGWWMGRQLDHLHLPGS